MLHFVEQIIRHAAREIGSAILQQAEHDEITVPVVQFIESSARHHVGHPAHRQALGIQFELETQQAMRAVEIAHQVAGELVRWRQHHHF